EQRGRGRVRAAPHGQPLAGPGQQIKIDHVVGRAPVAEGTGTARVIADHAADRAAAVRGRIGPEPQAVRRGRALQVIQDSARIDGRGGRVRVDVADTAEIPGEVEYHAGPDSVARDRRA